MASLSAPARRKARDAAAEALGPGPFFDGGALRAAKDRAAAGAALSTPFAEIVIWLAVAFSLGTAGMLTIEALARLGASCGVA